MNRLDGITLGDIARGLGRYRAFFALTTVILLIAVFAPGEQRRAPTDVAADLTDPTGQRQAVIARGDGRSDGREGEHQTRDRGAVQPAESDRADSGSQALPSQAAPETKASGSWQTTQSSLDLIGSRAALTAPNCDPDRGRIRFPTNYAAPCLPQWPRGRDNGDATARGVTRDEITIAIRDCPRNLARDAALSAAGAGESEAEQRDYLEGFVDIYNSHYSTYGRVVNFEYFGSSCSGDEEAGADAKHAAHSLEAFAAVSITDDAAYADALSHEGVVNITLDGPPRDTTLERAPYSWSRLKNPESQLTLLAEYVGKRLVGGEAKWAGDPALQLENRTFGLVYPEDPAVFNATSREYFEGQLAEYGVSLAASIGVDPDPGAAQEQARPAIGKLQEADVNSVILYADYLLTVFITHEATRQTYYPEWVMGGALLQDGTIFGRTYDQTQWSNAFGLSALQSAQNRELYNNHVLYTWHHDEPPPGNTSVSVQPVIDILFLGIHLAGPNLTPETFAQGLFFGYPPSGGAAHDFKLTNQWSFGEQGLWEWPDYSAGDDVKEVWWDPQASGEDELGNQGQGMYREVDLGRRYTTGELPDTEPRVFDRRDTSTLWNEYPPGEDPRRYECRSYKWEYEPEDACGN